MDLDIDGNLENNNNMKVNGTVSIGGSGMNWMVPPNKPMRLGWQCPSCNRCYSPDVTMCSYCGPDYSFYYTPFVNNTPTIVTNNKDVNLNNAGTGEEA